MGLDYGLYLLVSLIMIFFDEVSIGF